MRRRRSVKCLVLVGLVGCVAAPPDADRPPPEGPAVRAAAGQHSDMERAPGGRHAVGGSPAHDPVPAVSEAPIVVGEGAIGRVHYSPDGSALLWTDGDTITHYGNTRARLRRRSLLSGATTTVVADFVVSKDHPVRPSDGAEVIVYGEREPEAGDPVDAALWSWPQIWRLSSPNAPESVGPTLRGAYWLNPTGEYLVYLTQLDGPIVVRTLAGGSEVVLYGSPELKGRLLAEDTQLPFGSDGLVFHFWEAGTKDRVAYHLDTGELALAPSIQPSIQQSDGFTLAYPAGESYTLTSVGPTSLAEVSPHGRYVAMVETSSDALIVWDTETDETWHPEIGASFWSLKFVGEERLLYLTRRSDPTAAWALSYTLWEWDIPTSARRLVAEDVCLDSVSLQEQMWSDDGLSLALVTAEHCYSTPKTIHVWSAVNSSLTSLGSVDTLTHRFLPGASVASGRGLVFVGPQGLMHWPMSGAVVPIDHAATHLPWQPRQPWVVPYFAPTVSDSASPVAELRVWDPGAGVRWAAGLATATRVPVVSDGHISWVTPGGPNGPQLMVSPLN